MSERKTHFSGAPFSVFWLCSDDDGDGDDAPDFDAAAHGIYPSFFLSLSFPLYECVSPSQSESESEMEVRLRDERIIDKDQTWRKFVVVVVVD